MYEAKRARSGVGPVMVLGGLPVGGQGATEPLSRNAADVRAGGSGEPGPRAVHLDQPAASPGER